MILEQLAPAPPTVMLSLVTRPEATYGVEAQSTHGGRSATGGRDSVALRPDGPTEEPRELIYPAAAGVGELPRRLRGGHVLLRERTSRSRSSIRPAGPDRRPGRRRSTGGDNLAVGPDRNSAGRSPRGPGRLGRATSEESRTGGLRLRGPGSWHRNGAQPSTEGPEACWVSSAPRPRVAAQLWVSADQRVNYRRGREDAGLPHRLSGPSYEYAPHHGRGRGVRSGMNGGKLASVKDISVTGSRDAGEIINGRKISRSRPKLLRQLVTLRRTR